MDKESYAKWNDSQTKLLVSLYPGFKKRLDDGRIISAKRMWEQISQIMEEHGYSFTPVQVESKWKCLGRAVPNRKGRVSETHSLKRSFQPLEGNQLHLKDDSPTPSKMVSQVVKHIGVSSTHKDIMKMTGLKNVHVPSVLTVYTYKFDGAPSSSHQRQSPLIEHLSKPDPNIESEQEVEEEDGVHLKEEHDESTVHFSQPVLGSRQSARTVAEELCNLREEVERRHALKEKMAQAREQSRALRHQERIKMLKIVLDQINKQWNNKKPEK